MMSRSGAHAAWASLINELDEWRRAGLTAHFWARDDDAIAVTPQLERLISIAKAFEVEVGLAVIPARLKEELTDYLLSVEAPFFPMCHGWRHVNYGSPHRPGEFGPQRPLFLLRDDAKSAFESFSSRFGVANVIFVPPFARISPALVSELPGLGYSGVSTGPTATERRYARLASHFGKLLPLWGPVNGRPLHYDVHIDPFDWQAGRARSSQSIEHEAVGYLRARRLGLVPTKWPIGMLLHHLAFDEVTWRVCYDFLSIVAVHPAVSWPSVASMIERAVPEDSPRRAIVEAES